MSKNIKGKLKEKKKEYVWPKVVYRPLSGLKINHWKIYIHGERPVHFPMKCFCPCEVENLFLKQEAVLDRVRTIDQLMYVVL